MVFPSWACSQLINHVPAGDRMHIGRLWALDFWEADLGPLLLSLEASRLPDYL